MLIVDYALKPLSPKPSIRMRQAPLCPKACSSSLLVQPLGLGTIEIPIEGIQKHRVPLGIPESNGAVLENGSR